MRYVKGKSLNSFEQPLLVRIFDPVTSFLSNKIEKFTPNAYKNYLERKLILLRIQYTTQDILFLKLIAISSILTIGLLYSLNYTFDHYYLFIIIILGIMFVPDFILSIGLKRKREEILNELPIFLDLLIVILQGGATFDTAIQKICEQKKGTIYQEFERYINELKMGSTREESLNRLMNRVHLAEFNFVIRSIIHSENMGISVLTAIQNQASQLRLKRKNQLREKALKIPIKILFPLVFFIFPPIFIIILGPGVIQIFETLF